MTKRIISGFIAALFLFAAFSAYAIETNAQDKKDLRRAQRLTTEGNKFFLARDFRQAINKYAEAIVLAPNYPDAHFWKGHAHYNLKEFDQALTEFDLASAQNYSKPLDIYRLRWELHYQKQNLDAALDDVQKGLQIATNDANLLTALGTINLDKKDYRAALEAFQKAAQAGAAGGDLYYFTAVAHSHLGETEAQKNAASEAIKRGTKYVGESYFLVGDALQKEKKYDEALGAYQNALASKDDIYDVYRRTAEIYRNRNRYPEAIEVLLRALKYFPDDGNIYTDLSRFYALTDRNFKAIEAAQSAIKALPEQSAAYTNLCRAYNDTKQFQLAIEACSKALSLAPNDGETNFSLGFAYTSINKTEEAAKYYPKAVAGLEEAAQKNPEYFDNFYLLGNAYTRNAEYEKAVEAYKKSIELNPRFMKARYNLGSIYKFLKKDDLAREQYDAMLAADKDLAEKFLKEVLEKS